MLGRHVEVLQPQTGTAFPGREAPVKQREGDRLAVDFGDQRLGGGRVSEQRPGEKLRVPRDLLGRTLVLRQFADQREDQVDVRRLGSADRDLGGQGGPTIPGRPEEGHEADRGFWG